MIIYCIHCITSGKKYVGQTKQPLMQRFNQHMAPYGGVHEHRKPRIKQALEKYGKDAFMIGIVEECEKDVANERETYWIQELNAYTEGYNSKPEAIGTAHSAETRAKMSATWKAKGTSNRKGKTNSEESNAKRRATFARRKALGLNVGAPKGTIPWNKK